MYSFFYQREMHWKKDSLKTFFPLVLMIIITDNYYGICAYKSFFAHRKSLRMLTVKLWAQAGIEAKDLCAQ